MMRAQVHHTRSIDGGMIVPTAEIETFLSLGWRLADEPSGGARIVIHRVPINHKKMTGRSGYREPVKNDFDNAKDRTGQRQ